MPNRTAEIRALMEPVGYGFSTTVSRAEQCLESARDKYETATMHGWHGVAGNLDLTAGSLDGVVEQLATTEQAIRASISAVDQITVQRSSLEVAGQLSIAFGA